MLITFKKDLSLLVRVVSFAFVFMSALIIFIISYGFYGIGTTPYEIEGFTYEKPIPSYDTEKRYIKLFNSNFSPLAGALGIGYFFHTFGVTIMVNNANPRNNERDLAIGYLSTGLTYIAVGVLGSIGFTSTYFTTYY